MRKLPVNYAPIVPTTRNKTAAPPRTRIAALLTISAALLAATTLGGATPASAEDALPAPPQKIPLIYFNGGSNGASFCLKDFTPDFGSPCTYAQSHNERSFHGVFKDSGKAKVEVCADISFPGMLQCKTLEVPITPDAKPLCFATYDKTFQNDKQKLDFELFQVDCNGGARLASAESAPPPPPPATTTPDGTGPASVKNTSPVSPTPQEVTVEYNNGGFYVGKFCLSNAKSVIGSPCQDVLSRLSTKFQKVVFKDGGKAKIKSCAQLGTCRTLEIPITPNTKSLCFKTNGTPLNLGLFQVNCKF